METAVLVVAVDTAASAAMPEAGISGNGSGNDSGDGRNVGCNRGNGCGGGDNPYGSGRWQTISETTDEDNTQQ